MVDITNQSPGTKSERIAQEVIGEAREGCKWCGHPRIVKAGKDRKGDQLWLCRRCRHRFKQNSCPPRMRTPARAIALAHDLYYDGLSLRRTRRNLGKAFGIARDHKTVLRWLNKYPRLIEPFLDCFPAQVGPDWAADETQVKVKGAKYWVWETMDLQTRFLLSLIETPDERTNAHARELFLKAKALGGRPQRITTDKLGAYNFGIRKAFWHPSPLKRVVHETGGPDVNARIERYHGSYKDRYKVMRAFKSPVSSAAINAGFRVHHNFLRPHMALGTTPAVAAGITLPLAENDGWSDLIRCATWWQTRLRLT